MKLTKVNIAKVAVPSGKSEIIEFDDDVPGFGLRVRSGGSATWIFQYRQGSKQRRLSLGSAAAITAQNGRERASELHARVRLGQDPAGEKTESRIRAPARSPRLSKVGSTSSARGTVVPIRPSSESRLPKSK